MYDLLIIGGGIAGITAAIYAKRYGMKLAVISPYLGGLLLEMNQLHNYPGYTGATGPELVEILKEQIKGIEVIKEEALKIENGFKVTLRNKTLSAKTLIIATGTHKKHLNIDEHRFLGKGISYCATCDAPLFEGMNVLVYGDGISAAYSAIIASEHAKTIAIISQKKLSADKAIMEKLKKKNIPLIKGKITSLYGKNFLEGVVLSGGKKISAQGLIVSIGSIPTTGMLSASRIKHDAKGFIKTDKNMETAVKGIFAAGDVVSKDFRQLVSAASEGAVAAHSAHKFLSRA
jgi:thioredoxin reductase